MRFVIKANESDQLRTAYWSDNGAGVRDWSGRAEEAISFASREEAEKYLATNPHIPNADGRRVEIVEQP